MGINYGEHDSDFLLLEYGFIVSSIRNLNDSVSFTWNDFNKCLWESGFVLKCDLLVADFLKSLVVKEKEGLCISYSGPSWQFLIVLILISSVGHKNYRDVKEAYKSLINGCLPNCLIDDLLPKMSTYLKHLCEYKLSELLSLRKSCEILKETQYSFHVQMAGCLISIRTSILQKCMDSGVIKVALNEYFVLE